MAVELMTPGEVAKELRLAENTVYIWLRQGRLRGVKLGRSWRIRRQDVEALVEPTRPAPAEDAPASAVADEEEVPIWEMFAEIFRDVPEEERRRIPQDWAENLDHYIYGTPRRGSKA